MEASLALYHARIKRAFYQRLRDNEIGSGMQYFFRGPDLRSGLTRSRPPLPDPGLAWQIQANRGQDNTSPRRVQAGSRRSRKSCAASPLRLLVSL